MRTKRILFVSWFVLFFPLAPCHGQLNGPSIFGLDDYRMTYDSSLREKAVEVGAKWVRQFVSWADIEPSAPGSGIPQYDWNKYDSLFLDYQNRGLRVIALLGGIPAWVDPKAYNPVYPDHAADFIRFVEDLVERYDGDSIDDAPGSPVVNFFEFFNEPDLNLEQVSMWASMWGPKATEYAQMLKDVHPRIKEANPNAMVVFGGLALEDIGPDPPEIPNFNLNFLDEVLVAGGGPYFDVMNFHYYNLFAPVWAPWGNDIIGKTIYVRERLNFHGVLAKPIFVTEAGEWSGSLAGRTEELQAQYVVKLFLRALAADIKLVAWFILRDWDCSGQLGNETRGLFRCDGSPKPAYYAYKTTSSLLQGVTYQGRLWETDEDYKFFAGGMKYIYALWSASDTSTIRLQISSPEVTRIDKSGNQQTIFPVSPGNFDLTVGPDPIFLLFEIGETPQMIYVAKDGTCGGKTLCFSSIQDGINAANGGTTLMISQDTFVENVILNSPKELTLQGGLDSSFTALQSATTIQGSLTITDGKAVLRNVTLE